MIKGVLLLDSFKLLNILWSEASFTIDFPEITMFYPSVIECDLLFIIKTHYDIIRTICIETKRNVQGLANDLLKYIETPLGIVVIALSSPGDYSASDYINIGLPMLKTMDLNKVNSIASLEKELVKTILLENVFYDLNNWFNILLMYYSPRSIHLLLMQRSKYITIPFIESIRKNATDTIVDYARRIAEYKYTIILELKGLIESTQNSIGLESIEISPSDYRRHECITRDELKQHKCSRVLLLVPTLGNVLNKVKDSIKESILNNTETDLVVVATRNSCRDAIKLVNVKELEQMTANSKKGVRVNSIDASLAKSFCDSINEGECVKYSIGKLNLWYCIVSYKEPDYSLLDKNNLLDENTCVVIISEFPKHMLVELIKYLVSREKVISKVFVLTPKKPIANYLVKNLAGILRIEDGKVVDVESRFSAKGLREFLYCLQSLDDVF